MKSSKKKTEVEVGDLMTETEAASYIGVSTQWLRCSRMARPAWIGPRFIKVSKRRVRYRRRHLDEFLAARVIDPADRLAIA